MLYMTNVTRALVCAILLLLFADASGAMAFVSPETCTAASERSPDDSCPPLCVRCGCCAQPVVRVIGPVLSSEQISQTAPPVYTALPSAGSPHDILHVPK